MAFHATSMQVLDVVFNGICGDAVVIRADDDVRRRLYFVSTSTDSGQHPLFQLAEVWLQSLCEIFPVFLAKGSKSWGCLESMEQGSQLVVFRCNHICKIIRTIFMDSDNFCGGLLAADCDQAVPSIVKIDMYDNICFWISAAWKMSDFFFAGRRIYGDYISGWNIKAGKKSFIYLIMQACAGFVTLPA